MDIRSEMMVLCVRMDIEQIVNPLLHESAIGGNAAEIHGVSTYKRHCLEQRHCVIQDTVKV